MVAICIFVKELIYVFNFYGHQITQTTPPPQPAPVLLTHIGFV